MSNTEYRFNDTYIVDFEHPALKFGRRAVISFDFETARTFSSNDVQLMLSRKLHITPEEIKISDIKPIGLCAIIERIML